MKADEPMGPGQSGRRAGLRLVGAILAAVMAAAACAGENLFTGLGSGASGLLGPRVDITAPQPGISIAPGDSVNVTANIVSSEGVTEVAWTGTLVAGGPAPFTPVVVPLSGVRDTTMSRYLKRSGTTGGAARIIVTARDLDGDTGADTIQVTLGS